MSSYQELTLRLETIISDLQNGDLELDHAISKYKEGTKIIKQLEDQLKLAENTIIKIKDTIK